MSGVSLLAYADRLAGDLVGLEALLSTDLSAFTGVHVLPFFTPFDGDDTGFDPTDHASVDPRLGGWGDIRRIADTRDVTADLIVNHVSSGSAEFQDWLARGTQSPHGAMFLTFDRVFPEGASEADITGFYRPRPGLPFTPYRAADGTRRLVWTTFMPSQIDVDITHPAGIGYLEPLADALAAGGVSTVRLDAVGYAVKTPGTDSFMTAETLEFVAQAAALIRGPRHASSRRSARPPLAPAGHRASGRSGVRLRTPAAAPARLRDERRRSPGLLAGDPPGKRGDRARHP